MQIFVSGTWKAEKASPFRDQATRLGGMLAASGVDLTCGPGTGISRYVIDGFRAATPTGKVRFYLPSESEMRAAGETVEAEADEIEHTELDYPMRNLTQVKASDGVFVLTGGDGALEEIVAAVVDYRVPVAVVVGSGRAADAARLLVEVFPQWLDLVSFGADVEELFDALLRAVRGASLHRG